MQEGSNDPLENISGHGLHLAVGSSSKLRHFEHLSYFSIKVYRFNFQMTVLILFPVFSKNKYVALNIFIIVKKNLFLR
jgi:hypothetical protein